MKKILGYFIIIAIIAFLYIATGITYGFIVSTLAWLSSIGLCWLFVFGVSLINNK
jgi:hypothetical protein